MWKICTDRPELLTPSNFPVIFLTDFDKFLIVKKEKGMNTQDACIFFQEYFVSFSGNVNMDI